MPAVDVAALRLSPSLVVGIGEPHQGVDGFRRTHLEANEALRVSDPQGGAHVWRYRDVSLAARLTQDRERARWFVESELGELATEAPLMNELRETLRVYYGARMRVAPAAEALFVHRNTLSDRLDRIEQFLGHPVDERTAETQAALLLCGQEGWESRWASVRDGTCSAGVAPHLAADARR